MASVKLIRMHTRPLIRKAMNQTLTGILQTSPSNGVLKYFLNVCSLIYVHPSTVYLYNFMPNMQAQQIMKASQYSRPVPHTILTDDLVVQGASNTGRLLRASVDMVYVYYHSICGHATGILKAPCAIYLRCRFTVTELERRLRAGTTNGIIFYQTPHGSGLSQSEQTNGPEIASEKS